MPSLTTRNKFKRYARISESVTKHDALIDALVISGSAKIELFAGRKFGGADYREWFSGDDSEITIRNWPIIWVNRVMFSCGPALQLEYTGSDIQATVTVYFDEFQETTGIRLDTLSAAGTPTVTERTFANFPTLSLMATELNGIADWIVTQEGNDWSVKDLFPLASVNALNQKVSLTRPDQFCQYRAEPKSGIIQILHLRDATIDMRFNPYDRPLTRFQGFMVDYRGGFDVIPSDVEQAANEFIHTMFEGSQNSGQVKSENLGDYSYSLADRTEIDERQRSILALYTDMR